MFVCGVFLSLSARQVGRKLGVFLDPSRVGLRSKAQDDEGVFPPFLDSSQARQAGWVRMTRKAGQVGMTRKAEWVRMIE